ncbi:MAG: hypothetical protein A2Y56_05635 [Candidatus Aminicenantes bacterium RBG_13_63_10]|nr:MAG: hypothetical protein A2Y56_05635 [Candidatus Aminicenantes bacterium RBG_13_63_10]
MRWNSSETRRRGRCLLAALWLAGAAAAAPAAAQDEDRAFSWTAEVETSSRYLWRGIPWSGGAVLQPSFGVSADGWTFELWANFNLADAGARGLDEIDLSLSYLKEWPGLMLEPGLNVFAYPGAAGGEDPPTVEAVLKAGLRLAGPVSIIFEQALDLGAYPGGYYAEAGLGLDLELLPEVALEAAVSQSFGSKAFNRAYWDVSRGLLDAAFLRAALTWSIGGGIFVRARIEEAVLTGEPLREAAGRGSFFSFGLALGLEH